MVTRILGNKQVRMRNYLLLSLETRKVIYSIFKLQFEHEIDVY